MKRSKPTPSKPWYDLVMKHIEILGLKVMGRVRTASAFWIFWKSHHCVVDSWDLGCFVNSSAWKLFELRTFKASDGHHPVKLVLENMQGGMLESAVTWIAADCWPGVPDPGPGSLAAWPIYHSTVKCKCSISALHCLASFHKFINCFPGDRTRTADACAANKHVLHTSSRRSTPPASLERCCWWYLLPRISASSWATRGEVAWSSEWHTDQNGDWYMQCQSIIPSCIGHSLQHKLLLFKRQKWSGFSSWTEMLLRRLWCAPRGSDAWACCTLVFFGAFWTRSWSWTRSKMTFWGQIKKHLLTWGEIGFGKLF